MEINTMTLLVSFHHQKNKHIVQLDDLGDCICENNRHGIEYIKEFDTSKLKFIRLSKDQLIRRCKFDTHAMVELEKTGYIKA